MPTSASGHDQTGFISWLLGNVAQGALLWALYLRFLCGYTDDGKWWSVMKGLVIFIWASLSASKTNSSRTAQARGHCCCHQHQGLTKHATSGLWGNVAQGALSPLSESSLWVYWGWEVLVMKSLVIFIWASLSASNTSSSRTAQASSVMFEFEVIVDPTGLFILIVRHCLVFVE